jgi:hypothetical protein
MGFLVIYGRLYRANVAFCEAENTHNGENISERTKLKASNLDDIKTLQVEYGFKL